MNTSLTLWHETERFAVGTNLFQLVGLLALQLDLSDDRSHILDSPLISVLLNWYISIHFAIGWSDHCVITPFIQFHLYNTPFTSRLTVTLRFPCLRKMFLTWLTLFFGVWTFDLTPDKPESPWWFSHACDRVVHLKRTAFCRWCRSPALAF